MMEVDRQNARERNQQRRDEGTTARERLMAITLRLTAGRMTTKGRHYHMNSDVLSHIQRHENNNREEILEKTRKADLLYLQHCHIADEIFEKNKGKDVEKWRNANDIARYIKPSKHNDNYGKMPTKQSDIVLRYHQWRLRGRLNITPDEIVRDRFDEWVNNYQSNNS